MDPRTLLNRLIPPEVWEQYEKNRLGLIEERSYDDCGLETREEEACWKPPELSIKESFHPMRWNSGFTGRGSKFPFLLIVMSLWNVNDGLVVKSDEKTMERPGLVGPKGEELVINVDPVSGETVYKVEYRVSFQSELRAWTRRKRRSSVEAASKIYKSFEERVVNVLEWSLSSTSLNGAG